MLFDHFPDGRKVLGGAPFNVAWNLRGFGFNPFFVSAVGDDDEGESIRQRMVRWGLDTAGLQSIAGRSTGKVTVSLVDGQPKFEIVPDQAYDFITSSEREFSADRFALLYHGSLVLRGQQTRKSLAQVIATNRLPRFVDVNIRRPHFDTGWLAELLWRAAWVKLNDDELASLSGIEIRTQQDVENGVAKLRTQYGEATYFVTCGAKGAYAVSGSDVSFAAAPPPSSFRDSVGAGDAFASATIAGLLSGVPVPKILASAVAFASRICGITGATSDDQSLYRGILT